MDHSKLEQLWDELWNETCLVTQAYAGFELLEIIADRIQANRAFIRDNGGQSQNAVKSWKYHKAGISLKLTKPKAGDDEKYWC